MRKKLRRWETAGAAFVCVMGTLLHFAYDWSGKSGAVALFAAVNESTWEHMKILFVPYFCFTMAEFTAVRRALDNFFAVKAVCTLFGVLLIPAMHYTVCGAFGAAPAWWNIAVFYLSAVLTYALSYRALLAGALRRRWMQAAGLAAMGAMLGLFMYCTLCPPCLPIFRDPRLGRFGAGGMR